MNDYTIGFCQQTQKLEQHYMSSQLTLEGKGLSYLLSTRVVRASPSTSSATITRGFLCALASSSAGTIC